MTDHRTLDAAHEATRRLQNVAQVGRAAATSPDPQEAGAGGVVALLCRGALRSAVADLPRDAELVRAHLRGCAIDDGGSREARAVFRDAVAAWDRRR